MNFQFTETGYSSKIPTGPTSVTPPVEYTTQDLHTSIPLTTSPQTEKPPVQSTEKPGDNEVPGKCQAINASNLSQHFKIHCPS